MRTILISLIFASALGALQLSAATEYVIRVEGEDGSRSGRWTVHTDGTNFRVDREGEALLHDTLIADATTITALNSSLQTWYTTEATPFHLKSRYLDPQPAGRVKRPKWKLVERAAGTSGTQKIYDGTLSYVVRSSDVVIDVDAVIEVATDTAYDHTLWLGRILPRTSHDAVNDALDGADAAIEGLPHRMTMTVRRRYRGGEPMTQSMTITVSEIREVPTDRRRFVRPAEYRFQEPVLGFPGR